MGLGKTIQSIAFLAHLRFIRGVSGPYLVVAPLTVLSTWVSEFKRACPGLSVVKMHSAGVHLSTTQPAAERMHVQMRKRGRR